MVRPTSPPLLSSNASPGPGTYIFGGLLLWGRRRAPGVQQCTGTPPPVSQPRCGRSPPASSHAAGFRVLECTSPAPPPLRNTPSRLPRPLSVLNTIWGLVWSATHGVAISTQIGVSTNMGSQNVSRAKFRAWMGVVFNGLFVAAMAAALWIYRCSLQPWGEGGAAKGGAVRGIDLTGAEEHWALYRTTIQVLARSSCAKPLGTLGPWLYGGFG